jgi:hypothetical protein
MDVAWSRPMARSPPPHAREEEMKMVPFNKSGSLELPRPLDATWPCVLSLSLSLSPSALVVMLNPGYAQTGGFFLSLPIFFCPLVTQN